MMPQARASRWGALIAAGLLGFSANGAAQLPTLEAFLGEAVHPVRGRLLGVMHDDPDPRLGVELTMPSSIATGSFDVVRQEFLRHPAMLPSVRIAWTDGRAIEEQLVRSPRTEYTPTPRETRGDGWIALIEWPSGSPHVQVVVRLPSPRGELDCIGAGGSEITDATADRVRDWLLARCRSARIVPLP